jgi:nitrate reductase gamma subunit
MRKFKLYLLSIAMAFGLLALPFASASAAGYDPFSGACPSGSSEGAVCSTKTTTDPLTGTDGLISKVTKIIAIFSGVAAVIIIIIGGFMYVTSGGDSGKVSVAKDTIIYACVGLVVIVLGQSIIIFVIDRV